MADDSKFDSDFMTLARSYGCNGFAEYSEFYEYFAEAIKSAASGHISENPNDIYEHIKTWYTKNHVDSYIIIPLDIGGLGFMFSKEVKRRKILDYRILSKEKEPRKLIRKLRRVIPSIKCDVPLIEHFNNKTHGALFERPLLIKKYNGTYAKVSKEAKVSYEILRKWMDLHAAIAGSKNKFGGNIENSLALEYKPEFDDFSYLINSIFSSISVDVNDNFIDLINRSEIEYTWLRKLLAANNKMSQRISVVLDHFSTAFNAKSVVDRFVYYMIAFEALFSKSKDTPIRVTLADYTAILWNNRKERLDIHKFVRKIYDERSGLFHNGLWSHNEDLITRLEYVLGVTIYNIFNMIRVQKIENEETLFAKLDSIKIGASAS
jgi:hypothetical protein